MNNRFSSTTKPSMQVYLPFSLQKIDRVTFGIMSSEQACYHEISDLSKINPNRGTLGTFGICRDHEGFWTHLHIL